MRILCVSILFLVIACNVKQEQTLLHKEDVALEEELENNDLVYIVAVGDIMYGTSFPNFSTVANDSVDLFRAVRPFTKGHELVFGNLEGVILDDTLSPPRDCQIPEQCYRFRMPVKHAGQLSNAGFTILSTANNHSNDFKEVGRLSTQHVLDRLQIGHAGMVERPFLIYKTKEGLRVGLVAASPNTGSVHLLRENVLLERIKETRRQCDILIVSAHMGGEGDDFLHITKEEESYLSEKRGNPYVFARKVIDAGADLVLGHGPHVPRAVDLYKGKFIIYSMGNFMTYSRVSVKGNMGLAPLYKIGIHKKTGAFVEAELISFIQGYRKPILLDKEDRAFRLVKHLTQIDFPDNGLSFEGNQIRIR